MPRRTVRVERRGHGNARVFLDDEELEGVRSVEVRMGHGEPDRVLIELLPERVSVEDVGRPVTMIPALEVRFDGQD